MASELVPGDFVFATVPEGARALAAQAIATIQESEGLSVILPVGTAGAAGLSSDMSVRRITLNVNSALDGVGLTAAVAGALASEGIGCNMVAGHHHDHVFVPAGQADEA